MGKFPKIGEFTDEELTAWLNTLDISTQQPDYHQQIQFLVNIV